MMAARFGWSRWLGSAVLVAGIALLAGCAAQRKTVEKEQKPARPVQMVTVKVAKENLRDAPGGTKIGETKKGKKYSLLMRRGNWCEIGRGEKGSAWIWAPSLGLTSVNPMSLSLWMGDDDEAWTVDTLSALVGPPSSVETYGKSVVIYIYKNEQGNGRTLFGTHNFTQVKAWVDRSTRTIFRCEMTLPPFEGTTNDLLAAIGLPKTKSSGIDFEHATYINRFSGISNLELFFQTGNFRRISSLQADRFAPGLWQRYVHIDKRKLQTAEDHFELEMTLTNQDAAHVYAAPSAEVSLYLGSRPLGKWTVGPAVFTLAPGATGTFRLSVPYDASKVDPKQVNVRAELVSMLVLPAKSGGKTL